MIETEKNGKLLTQYFSKKRTLTTKILSLWILSYFLDIQVFIGAILQRNKFHRFFFEKHKVLTSFYKSYILHLLHRQKMITLRLHCDILIEIEFSFFLILYTIKYGFVFFFNHKICDNTYIGRKIIVEYLSKFLNSNAFQIFFSLSTTLFVTLMKLSVK